MIHKHQRLATLIGQGIKATEACDIVGISKAYYSRLSSTEEFKELLRVYAAPDNVSTEQAKAKLPAIWEEHDEGQEAELREDRWSALEAAALRQATSHLATAELKDLNKTLSIIAQRRSSNKSADAAMLAAKKPAAAVLVTLNLPAYQREQIVKDNEASIVTTSSGEVVSVDGRELLPMATADVTEILDNHKEASKPMSEEDAALISEL